MDKVGIRTIVVNFDDEQLPYLSLVQGDAKTRGFDIVICDSDGKEIPPSNDYIVELVATASNNPDTPYANRHTIKDGKYRVMIPTEALSESGFVFLQLVFYQKSTGAVIHTIEQKCPVYRSRGQEVVDSNNLYVDITALRLGIEKIAVMETAYLQVLEDEETRQSQESTRQSQEADRVSAENSRVEVENTRKLNEENRVSAEGSRVEVESVRVTAEDQRKSNETQRIADEKIRLEKEVTRQSEEATRKSAEDKRIADEKIRQSNETTRKSQETARQSAEIERVSSETTRASEEATRKANEIKRENNEVIRIDNENNRIIAEKEREVNEAQRQKNKLVAGANVQIDGATNTISATDTITTINGKTGAISKSDITALGIPSQDTVYTHPPGTNPHGTTKSDVGLGNVDNVKQMPISGGVLENYREKLVTVSASSPTINLNLGNVFQHSPSGNTTYLITNAVNSQAHSFTLIINMGSTVRTLTFPASIKWQGGEIPDMSETNKTYVLTFMSVNGGTNWLGMFGGEF